MNGTHQIPAPSLRELSSECETEGVSFDGCSGPMVYIPAHINSETFNRLRSSGYTPSVTPVGRDSSLREGAWRGAFPAPSLRELSSERETEGVSSDGCSGPMVYIPAHMNSEIFERLRSPKYTPSASLRSAAPSEREPGTSCTIQPGTR